MQFPALLKRIGMPLIGLAVLYGVYSYFGWRGLAFAVSAVVMWALMHFNRMMQVLRRASKRPVGYVDSAVMLNAKLKPKANLMHLIAMTRALGELRSPANQQPEIYRWTDGTDSYVDCEFFGGKLQRWNMVRPVQPDEAPPAPAGAE